MQLSPTDWPGVSTVNRAVDTLEINDINLVAVFNNWEILFRDRSSCSEMFDRELVF